LVVTAPGRVPHEETIELGDADLIVQVRLVDAPRPRGRDLRGRAAAARDDGGSSATSRRRSKHSFDPDGIIDPFERRR
jgi:hypothetical protein